MAESYGVTAIFSAVDKNLTSTAKQVEKSLQGVGSGAKSSLNSIMNIAGGIGVFKALDTAVQTVTSHLGDAIDRYDTLNSFPKVMRNMGYSTKEAEKSMEKLSAGIEKVPTSLDTVVGVSKRIALLTGNLGKATDTTLALNNAMIASGSSSADAERGMTQYIQMLSKGKVDAQSWYTLQETMSYALGETAKKLGITSGNTMELYSALQSGKISFDEFNKALIECNEGTGGFAEMAVTASGGIKTAMSNMGIYITRGLANAMKSTDKMLKANGFGKIEDIINQSSQHIITASDAICDAIENIGNVQGIISGFGATLVSAMGAGALTGLPTILSSASETLTKMGKASKETGKAVRESLGAMKDQGAKIKPLFDKIGGSAKVMFDSGVERGATIPTLFNNIEKSANSVSSAIGGKMVTKLDEFYKVTGRFDGGGLWKAFDQAPAVFGKFTSVLGTTASGIGKYFSFMVKVAMKAFVPSAIIGAVLVGLGLLYQTFGTQIDEIIAMVTTKAPQIITNLANSVVSQIPMLLEMGSTLVLGFMNAITANLPALMTAGVDIITSLINGVAEQLPLLIPMAVTMIMTLAEGLANNSGKILNAGINLLKGLASGIVKSIPIVTKKAPEIISKLATTFIQNLPKMITTGVSIIGKIAVGLIKAIPQLVGKIPTIVSQMISAFKSVNWGSVGGDIVRGIAHGVASGAGALFGALKSLAKSALEKAKSVLKIGSPSRVFKREVGKWIPIGMAKGIQATTSSAVKAVKEMQDKVYSASGVDLLSANGGLYGRYAVATGYTSTSEVFANQNATYTFNISSDMDGREVAKGTATYTKKELEKLENREARKNGGR